MAYVIIKFYINRCSFTHDTLNRHEILVHPVQILFLIPYIAIHCFFKGFQIFKV